ncbi:MAG TPA: hypothetical protein VNZ44_04700, partial [Pyrinomonadaceae bacterium]|nr:hypothetical protein [Pyrinomonadaceae bacterium]
MNRLLLSLAGITALALLLPQAAAAFQNENQSYLPLSDAETANSFPVEYVGAWDKARDGSAEEARGERLPGRLNV